MKQIKNPTKNSVFRAGKNSTISTQEHLRFGEIKKNTIIMKDGSLRAVLQVSSVNFNLKSEEEQNAIIFAYQDFLNSLDFPIQILVRSRKLSIENYILNVEKYAQKQQNPLLKRQTYEYLEYIRKLVDLADIMKKSFYAVVTYDPPEVVGQTFVDKIFHGVNSRDSLEALRKRWQHFDTNRRALQRRVTAVKSALANCRLQCAQLKTSELIELMYECYNPLTSREEKIVGIDNLQLLENEPQYQETALGD